MFMFYNFCRPHMTLRQGKAQRTPAMAAGVADHVWTLDELLALMPGAAQGAGSEDWRAAGVGTAADWRGAGG